MRSAAREVVFKYIFSKEFNQESTGIFDILLQSLDNDSDKDFAKELLNFVEKNEKDCEKFIEENLRNFKFNRLFKTDVCAIKLGMAELKNYRETPVPVAVDEAVKLASKYSTEKSPDFVNGILAVYVKTLGR